MKKFLIIIFCITLCVVSLFTLSACSNDNSLTDEINALRDEIANLNDKVEALEAQTESELPDFADCEIGYQLEVYPKVAFDYKVSEDCMVHIESITATLIAKNVINEGDVLTEPYYQYVIEYKATGCVVGNPPIDSYDGLIRLWVDLNFRGNSTTLRIVQFGENGVFEVVSSNGYMRENSVVYFLRIR